MVGGGKEGGPERHVHEDGQLEHFSSEITIP